MDKVPNLTVPFATLGPKMTVQGKYKNNYPQGAVIHYTAGHYENGDVDAVSEMRNGAAKGLCFFVIAYDGTIFQPAPLDHWGYHAGDSYHPGLGHSVSRKLVGIELCNAGILTRSANGSFTTWYNKTIPREEVRTSLAKSNIRAGYYHKFSEQQERSLENLLYFLYTNNPDVFDMRYVLGHDEVAPLRKTDPGASLSMSMPEFRAKMLKMIINVKS